MNGTDVVLAMFDSHPLAVLPADVNRLEWVRSCYGVKQVTIKSSASDHDRYCVKVFDEVLEIIFVPAFIFDPKKVVFSEDQK